MFKIGEWVYFANLPGTVLIKELSWPWYIPGKALYLVEFQNHLYYAFEWELER